MSKRADVRVLRFRAGSRLGTATVTIRPDGRSDHAVVDVRWQDGGSDRREVFGAGSAEHALELAYSKTPVEVVEE